jgi:hypothetical protein
LPASAVEIGRCISKLELVFREELAPRAAALYVDALADLEAAALDAAVRHLIRHQPRFFPTPGEIREAVPAPAMPLLLEAPYHRPFTPDSRSLDEIAANRRRLAPLWGEVMRVAKGGALRPFAEVLAELGLDNDDKTGGAK